MFSPAQSHLSAVSCPISLGSVASAFFSTPSFSSVRTAHTAEPSSARPQFGAISCSNLVSACRADGDGDRPAGERPWLCDRYSALSVPPRAASPAGTPEKRLPDSTIVSSAVSGARMRCGSSNRSLLPRSSRASLCGGNRLTASGTSSSPARASTSDSTFQ